jgi:hypothetical protein
LIGNGYGEGGALRAVANVSARLHRPCAGKCAALPHRGLPSVFNGHRIRADAFGGSTAVMPFCGIDSQSVRVLSIPEEKEHEVVILHQW